MTDFEDCSSEELAAYEEAMRMNEQLKAMIAAGGLQGVQPDEEDDQQYYEAQQPTTRRRGNQNRPHLAKKAGMSLRTEAPAGSHLKNRVKNNYTHNDSELRNTALENRKLFEKLNNIATGRASGTLVTTTRQSQQKKLSSNEINRRKQNRQTANANMQMLGRLQNVKSTISSSKLKQDYSKNRKVAKMIRQVKPKARAPRQEWAD